MLLPEAIVACARSWIGTRFHHQGRLKKSARHRGGVDCLGLLVGVANELKLRLPDGSLLGAWDETDYSHLPDTLKLRTQLAKLLREIRPCELRPGDIVLLNVDGNPQHLGIISDMQGVYGLIHAYAPARAVVEHGLDAEWCKRVVTAYRAIF